MFKYIILFTGEFNTIATENSYTFYRNVCFHDFTSWYKFVYPTQNISLRDIPVPHVVGISCPVS